MSFIRDWDIVAIEQWESLDNEYAILTTYPSEVKTAMDENGNSLVCHYILCFCLFIF